MSGKSFVVIGADEAFQYEITQIIRLFFEADDLQFIQTQVEETDVQLYYATTRTPEGVQISCRLLTDGRVLHLADEDVVHAAAQTEEGFMREQKRAHLRLGFKVLSELTGTKPPWGILFGVRPTKVAHELLAAGCDDKAALGALEERFCMSREKGALILQVARKEQRFIHPSEPRSYALYFGVPFCPSRCSYCSFPAFTGQAKFKLIPAYAEAMVRESRQVSSVLKHRYADSVYVGGGTPTMFSAAQLDALLSHIRECYDLSACREITVEAGRPDTITHEKLTVLRSHGVDRICLNPQSFSDRTLKRIGRHHEVGDVYAAVEMIRKAGFRTLNMDIILGLPGESPADVAETLKAVAAIAPENLTVHTLAIKRGSELRQQAQEQAAVAAMEAMLALSAEAAARMGLEPYYMYRQKFMLANLENVGYAKPGHECIYNMQIMEEQQDILSFGTGGVSKICFPAEGRHERVPNVRGLEEYLERADEMAQRKISMLASL